MDNNPVHHDLENQPKFESISISKSNIRIYLLATSYYFSTLIGIVRIYSFKQNKSIYLKEVMWKTNLTIWAGSTIGYPVRSLNIATNSSAILENKDVS